MEINITVPSQLCDIKLHQYKKYVKLLETVEEGENRDSFVSLKMLEIFCNVPYQTAIKFKMQDVNKIIATILELLSSKNELVKRFRMGDTEFGFIPKLDDMTFGEYIDLDNYLGKWDNIEKAMAVLYRPITKSSQDLYDIADYQGDTYHEIMNEMPMDAVLSSIVFFYRLGIELSQTMMNYLQTNKEIQQELKQGLEKNGDGMHQFTNSLNLMLQELKISQE
tara:strand:- start:193 stop:858 length:666 start_codon:yes stop_codon:yes gene_type:complete